MATNKILIIVTNVGEYEKVGYRTGLWLGELTHFYDYVVENGYKVDIASPAGGFVPIDPESLAHDVLSDLGTDKRYRDREFMDLLVDTRKATDLDPDDYDAIYFTGGHGVMWDFRSDDLGALTAKFYKAEKVVSAVCHGPAGLLNVSLSAGDSLLDGKNVTGFSWAEEEGAQRADVVPFNLEEELSALGGKYSKADEPFEPHVVSDGLLVTGQNPGSARGTAEAVVKALQEISAREE
ncbi:type 1 glutamine amidotransferase domain-containing protein [Antrihabitans sp. YC3-6]|uniref:Type 1 glutamine amidotransferase domain-containing protein n=1 Tax=Antrihabitans stalagmiti TaxID=2799499 RepID=A0A934NR24_9NOCA|nr:type 1 glutamine amidotransferase domain-containing protein [Antrihabitans stalagmiti]MBJ8339894.1 type 1 glutamine amidotransferase domain-containing protein [Antrihabitans stalagmiti]